MAILIEHLTCGQPALVTISPSATLEDAVFSNMDDLLEAYAVLPSRTR